MLSPSKTSSPETKNKKNGTLESIAATSTTTIDISTAVTATTKRRKKTCFSATAKTNGSKKWRRRPFQIESFATTAKNEYRCHDNGSSQLLLPQRRKSMIRYHHHPKQERPTTTKKAIPHHREVLRPASAAVSVYS